MTAAAWRPTATRERLVLRAWLRARCRRFFAERGVLEVDTPLLSPAALPETHIDLLRVESTAWPGRPGFLNPSPEAAMKRLLAAGSGPIYQIAPAFRDGDLGRVHRPEFSLLEWYRPGWTLDGLIEETLELVTTLAVERGLVRPAVQRLTVREWFQAELGLDPFSADEAAWRAAVAAAGVTPPDDLSGPHDGFDLAVALVLAPRLPPDRLTVVRDYPPEHAALARVRETPEGPVAERFELYWGPLELANGYQELTDPAEQRRRFEAANAARRAAGRLAWPLDGRFLAALEAGMPPAAGVALGLDRVLMRLAGAESLAEVMPFADDYPVVEQGRDEP